MFGTIHKKRRFEFSLAIFVIVLLLAVLFLNIIKKDRTFLDSERRSAKTIKDVRINIKDGKIVDDLEPYMKEQFVFRDNLLKIKSLIDDFLHVDFNNDVYICENQYFIEDENQVDGDYMYEKIENYKKIFSGVKCDVDFIIFPNAYYIYSDKLPKYAKESKYEYFIYLLENMFHGTNFNLRNMAEDIKNIKEDNSYNIYYKTDHHMTSDAFYKVKDTILSFIGISDNDKYERIKLTDTFQGSLMSKAARFSKVYDDIYMYGSNSNTRYILTDFNDNKKTSSIYDFAKVNSYDPYLTFLGGNSGYINIKTEKYAGKKLLVIKDSYFNAFLPYLVDKYREIDIIDPRYIDKNIDRIVDVTDYDNIIFFVNYNTFVTK